MTVQCIHGQNSLIIVHDRWEEMVLPSVTAIQLHHINMVTWTDCNVFETG